MDTFISFHAWSAISQNFTGRALVYIFRFYRCGEGVFPLPVSPNISDLEDFSFEAV